MAMEIFKTKISGVFQVKTTPFSDTRGSFSRLFCSSELGDILSARKLEQINISFTQEVGAIRGLHYQNPPVAEMKFVRCLRGRVFDVAVDLRSDSPTFLQWVACELTPHNNLALIIPEGCAHGFQVLEAGSQLLYMHTELYCSDAEGGVRFDDPLIGIDWPLKAKDISVRDGKFPWLTNEFKGVVV